MRRALRWKWATRRRCCFLGQLDTQVWRIFTVTGWNPVHIKAERQAVHSEISGQLVPVVYPWPEAIFVPKCAIALFRFESEQSSQLAKIRKTDSRQEDQRAIQFSNEAFPSALSARS